MRYRRQLLAALALLSLPEPPTAGATTPSDSLTIQPVSDLQWTTDLAWRPGDADGMFLVSQDGLVRRLSGDQQVTVLDISVEIHAEYEMGLLGLAFDPSGQFAYVNYIAADDFRTVVEEFPVEADGTFAVADRRVVIEVDQPETNHNGGGLEFGPDGMLYVGMGDGGNFGDPNRTAQDGEVLLGKMLRVDPRPGSSEPGYAIPDDGPFVDDVAVRPEIWALGLRNPWRFSFDPETGDLWIADVGEGAAEEVNATGATAGRDAGRGLNFGWSAFEGDETFNGGLDEVDHTPPLYSYGHDGGRCSISGGAVARGPEAGPLDGWYVFGDYCSGEVFALLAERVDDGGGPATITLSEVITLGVTVDRPRTIVASPDGALYVLGETSVGRLAG